MKRKSKSSGQELAIDLDFYPLKKDWRKLAAILPKKYAYKDMSFSQEEMDRFKKRYARNPHKVRAIVKKSEGLARISYSKRKLLKVKTNVGVLIEEFLKGLNVLKPMIIKGKGELRLGIFYDLEQTVIFPVIVNIKSIKRIAEFNLSMDSTGYPCTDGEMVEAPRAGHPVAAEAK